MDTMNSESSGGKTTLYIVVFFLCVISAMSGYFYFTINSAEAEAQKKIEKIQASAKQELATAKSEAEKREIAQKAAFETAKARVEATAKAKESALKSREAKIKAAEALVNKKLASAAASVKNANKLKADAAKINANAAKRKRDADAAMKKAIASGKAADMKVANEKKRLLKEYQKQVAAANKRVRDAQNKAKAEAKNALDLKNRLNQITQRAEMIIGTTLGLNASPGFYRSGMVWAGEGPRTSDPKTCQKWAASNGYAAWGHRNSKHPVSKYKNTCFGYKTVSAKYNINKYADDVHMIGCTFSDLRPDQVACPMQKAYKLRYERTAFNDAGGGNSIYLDRHDVNCGDDGLNSFGLQTLQQRGKRTKIGYLYGCVEGINAGRTNKNTGSNDWGGGNTIYLDRHNVNCGNNPIARFRLVRPASNKIRYDYSCSKANSTGKCTNKNTGWNQESSQNYYLDRHNVKCGTNEAITQFKLQRDGKGKFRYDYRCCKIT